MRDFLRAMTGLWAKDTLWAYWGFILILAILQGLPETRTPVWWPLVAIAAGASSAVVLFMLAYRKWGEGQALTGRYKAAGVVAAVFIVALSWGYRWNAIGPGTRASSVADPMDAREFPALLAYAESLQYDDTGHGAADSAWLTETRGDSVVRTVRGYIAPELHAHLNRHADLDGTGPGEGRVVARVRVDPQDRRGYPSLNLPPGISYLWVDSLGDSTYRLLVIPASGDRVLRTDSLARRYLRHPRRYANYPIARWLLADNTECANTPCDWHGCCETCPGLR